MLRRHAMSDAARHPRFLARALAAAAILAGCTAELELPGTPVAAGSLCAEIAAIVCEADDACFPGAGLEDCTGTLEARCGETIQPLVDDPRLGYDARRAGAFVEGLRARAAACWEEPIDYDAFVDVFAGTGAIGADCTPARLDASSLRASSLSCVDGAACRVHLRADGSPEGVCEARRDDACSHAYDCGAREFCSLPARWQPGVWGECRPLRADGWSCASDLECQSRHCDGTCAPRPALERPLVVSYADVVLDAAPIAYVRFDGTGATAADLSGHGHAAEILGGATRDDEGAIEGDEGHALRLASDEQYARIRGLGELEAEAGTGELTIECWFRRDEIEQARPILELTAGMEVGPHVWNHDRGDKVYANFVAESGEPHAIMSGEGVVAPASWHHVVATFDGAMGRLYLDGVRVGEASVEGAALAAADTLLIGHRFAAGESAAISFAGSIDEVAVYDRALDAATIRRHLEAGLAGRLENDVPLFSWIGE